MPETNGQEPTPPYPGAAGACGAFLVFYDAAATHVRVLSREGKTVVPKTALVASEGSRFQLARFALDDLPALALFSDADGQDIGERVYELPDRAPATPAYGFVFNAPAAFTLNVAPNP